MFLKICLSFVNIVYSAVGLRYELRYKISFMITNILQEDLFLSYLIFSFLLILGSEVPRGYIMPGHVRSRHDSIHMLQTQTVFSLNRVLFLFLSFTQTMNLFDF